MITPEKYTKHLSKHLNIFLQCPNPQGLQSYYLESQWTTS